MPPGSPADLDALLRAGYRYALSLTGGVDRAEDLLQDAWLALLQADGARTRPYLFRCIRSKHVDRHRRARLVAIDPLPPEELEAAQDEASAAADPRLVEATRAELAAALSGLRAEEREAVFLSAVEGYTAAEIGELMEAPRGTVLSLVHRARKKLQSALQGAERPTRKEDRT